MPFDRNAALAAFLGIVGVRHGPDYKTGGQMANVMERHSFRTTYLGSCFPLSQGWGENFAIPALRAMTVAAFVTGDVSWSAQTHVAVATERASAERLESLINQAQASLGRFQLDTGKFCQFGALCRARIESYHLGLSHSGNSD